MDVEALPTNLKAILFDRLKAASEKVVVIYDTECPLTVALKEGYEVALADYKNSEILNFADKDEEGWKAYLYDLQKGDKVVLIQSTSFRISSYRIRLDLTNRDIFVIEHIRLAYIDPSQYQTYLNSLHADYEYFDKVSENVMASLNGAERIEIHSGENSVLTYTGGFEEARPNVANFEGSMGTMFPVGEVFTEPKDITQVNGEMTVHTIPNTNHRTHVTEPFQLTIKDGCIAEHNGPEEFQKLHELIQTENEDGKVWLREMGFGLNRFISRDKPIDDITAHERCCGYHVSLGLKHGVYRKKISKKVNQRFHIDVFADVKKITADKNIIFENGEYSY